MARIAEEEIERINHEVSLQRLAEAHGVVLKPHGEGLARIFHESDSN